MITKSELIEYLKHTPENTNYNILYSSLYNGSNKEIVDEFIEVLSRGNLSLAALQPYLAKLYEDDKAISPDPLPPLFIGGSPDAVLYTKQTLTEAQKKQARENIDAASAEFVINGTVNSDDTVTLDKTFGQIQEAINAGKKAIIKVNYIGINFVLQFLGDTGNFYLFAVTFTVDYAKAFLLSIGVGENESTLIFSKFPAYDTDGSLPQVEMGSDPTKAMQIATKQYVDASGVPSVTAADNGKFLRVVNGAWAASEISSANGVSF